MADKYRRVVDVRTTVSDALRNRIQQVSDELRVPVRDVIELSLSIGVRLVEAALVASVNVATVAGSDARDTQRPSDEQ